MRGVCAWIMSTCVYKFSSQLSPPQKKEKEKIASINIYVCVCVEILNFGPNTPN